MSAPHCHELQIFYAINDVNICIYIFLFLLRVEIEILFHQTTLYIIYIYCATYSDVELLSQRQVLLQTFETYLFKTLKYII